MVVYTVFMRLGGAKLLGGLTGVECRNGFFFFKIFYFK